MPNSLVDLLPKVERAPKRPKGGGLGLSVSEKLRRLAVPIIEGCLTGSSVSQLHYAQLLGYSYANSIGDSTGVGNKKEKGAGLWKDGIGIRAVSENATLMIPYADQADLDALLARRGETPEQFLAAVAALPSHTEAKARTTAPKAPEPPAAKESEEKAPEPADARAVSPELAAEIAADAPAPKPVKQKGGSIVSRGKSYPVEVVRQV